MLYDASHYKKVLIFFLVAKTRHFGSRVSKRGIRSSTVELAQRYGVPFGDKLVLSKKQIKNLLGEFDEIRRNLICAMDKGGVVVVEESGMLITAYDFDSYRRY